MRLRFVLIMSMAGNLLAFSTSFVVADVVESAAVGFVVKNVATIDESPAKVYVAVVRGIGRWWDSEHTYSGDARNLSIDPRPGGCFCERLPGRGGVQHLTVIFVDPGKKLRLVGGLGPLQAAAVSGILTWDFAEAAPVTDRNRCVEPTWT